MLAPAGLDIIPAWFVVLPDKDANRGVVSMLRARATHVLSHPSSRPWVVGRWTDDAVAIGHTGKNALMVIGQHAVTAAQLTDVAGRTRTVSEVDRFASSLVGSAHILASIDGQLRVQGTVTGTRPVFTAQIDGIALAADRADVLAALLGTGLNEERLAVHLLQPPILYPVAGQPVWEGVELVSGQNYVVINDDGRRRTVHWWSPPEPVVPMAEGAPALRDALSAAVAARTQGRALVSCDLGGLDSTAVTSLAAREDAQIVAYTAATADPLADDVQWATRTVAALGNVEHHIIPADEMPLIYHGLLSQDDALDEPCTAAVDRDRWLILARRAAARGSRLHLTGFGGDELLYGSLAHLHGMMRSSPRTALRNIRGFAAKYRWSWGEVTRQLADRRPYDVWLAGVADTLSAPAPPSNEPLLGWGFSPRLPPWTTPDAVQAVRDLIRKAAPGAESLAVRRGQHRELDGMRFVSRLARQFDQIAARSGIAMANPYHDDRVIEAGLAVRPEERITPWRYKPLIVEAMRGVVPEQSRARQTKVNGTGDEEPGLRRHRAELLALWEDSRLARLGLINADRVREMCTRPLPPDLPVGVLDQSVACEVWLRSLERVGVPAQGGS
jgi:asparagine synthase (glutamine-hydrolysing)